MDMNAIKFKGTFRSYQQRILDNSHKYLKDGKINIVAAPGSGKTVLGLELLRRLNSPAIILSPTTAIRQQWGERLKGMFLEDESDFDSVFSNDIHKVKLFNSITYQALYTAIEKVSETAEDDTDCSDIDIFAAMRENGIKTVCLDEAHHLKNEWQRALEKFISTLDCDIKIVSLTATPPYDSDGNEWDRYISVCGEIDEEIFVPELVGQNTLCPHQDYIYFNYPTKEEAQRLKEYKEHAKCAVEEIAALDFWQEVAGKFNAIRDYSEAFSAAKEYIAVLVLLQRCGQRISQKLITELTAKRELPRFDMQYGETALQFLINSEWLTEKQKESVTDILKNHSLYEKRRVSLVLNEKLKRALISSVGKLESIKAIAQSEVANMGARLRMLVLTDYIKKEELAAITSATEFGSVNIVSIFETLRRENLGVKIGVLSGTLVILPTETDLGDIRHTKREIPGTDYCTVDIAGATHRAVDCVGKLFAEGEIQILVGTKSLLGEGWDAPCINSLILASFVGSFVLSNQMRGRAIRIDKNDPEKSSNIWHLITVEPEHIFKEKATEKIEAKLSQSKNKLISCDFEILKRRFDSFMGPNYESGVIESGIERITSIKPPYDEKGIARINAEMISLSAKRESVASKWKGEVKAGKFGVAVETEAPREKKVPIFTFSNVLYLLLLVIAETLILRAGATALIQSSTVLSFIKNACAFIVLIYIINASGKLLRHLSPAKSFKVLGKAVYKTLRDCDIISPDAKVEAFGDDKQEFISIQLRNASIHDQNIFNTAMTEMLSPIQNPRYILIAKTPFKSYNFALSFACPSVIGKKKEYVEILAKHLKSTSKFEPIYTHREDGRKFILKCRKHSYITLNQRLVNKKYKVSHYE